MLSIRFSLVSGDAPGRISRPANGGGLRRTILPAMGLLVATTLSSACMPTENAVDDDARPFLSAALLLYTPFTRITPGPGTITLAGNAAVIANNRSYTPACSGAAGNTEFFYFIKNGDGTGANKLLINFMGGGACWDAKNCFGDNTSTYFNVLNTLPDAILKIAMNGVMNVGHFGNPYYNWNIVFVPYCTGDLHAGSNDVVYTDPTNGVATTFRHRGFDNVLAVVDDIRTRYGFVDQILVTGQSAGGYGAIFNFPVIKESFPSARVDVLSDASNGVLPSAATQIQTLRAQYGLPANLPTWMTNTATPLSQTRLTSGALQVQDYFAEAAATYPNSRVAQYTSLYDGNQRFFYGVMQKIQAAATYTDATTQDPRNANRSYSALYGDSDGTSMADADSCAWRDGAASAMQGVAAAATNYTYFVAPGDVHTITTSDAMHTVTSGGQNFVEWLREFTGTGGIPARRECTAAGCSAPVSDASTPNALSANCGAAENTLF